MIYWKLFSTFFLIGAFCFGGGYAAIPLIQDTVITNGWMSMNEFMNMIAVAESTPGPVAVNTATYVGFKLVGYSGAAVATIGLCTPAFIIVVALSAFLKTQRGKDLIQKLMVGVKPVVVGLIFCAAWSVAKEVIFTDGLQINSTSFLDIIIMIIAFLAIHKFKVNPILLIALAAVLGIILV